MPRVFCSKHVFFFEQFLDGCSCQVDPFQSWIIIGFPAKEGWRSIYVYIYTAQKHVDWQFLWWSGDQLQPDVNSSCRIRLIHAVLLTKFLNGGWFGMGFVETPPGIRFQVRYPNYPQSESPLLLGVYENRRKSPWTTVVSLWICGEETQTGNMKIEAR